MKAGGALYVGTTQSKTPGRRWVVVGWTDDGDSCVMAALPEVASAPYTTVRGEEARVVRSSDLEKATGDGVLIAAGSLGGAALSLVVRTVANDQGTPETVRKTLRRTG
jgi:hypothetical protein